MTDSLQDAQSDSFPPVVKINETYCWELAAQTTAFPMMINLGKQFFKLYIYLAPYDAELLISILNAVPGSYKRNTADVEIYSGDDAKFQQLTDACFVRFDGADNDDPKAHKAFLDRNPRQKVRIARDLLGGIEIDTWLDDVPVGENERMELLPLALECNDNRVSTAQEVYDPVRKAEVKIKMQHLLRAETEADWRQFVRSGNESFNRATKQWKSAVNWWKRLELYDGMIQSIEGMVIRGQSCTQFNKAEWLKLIPAWHKLLVISNVFDEARVKNA